MQIRNADINDIQTIVDIGCRSRQKIYAGLVDAALWQKKQAEEFPAMYKNIIDGESQIENHFFPVLEDGEGIIIGYGIAGYVNEDWRTTLPLHWIHEIFLDPEKTGSGNGRLIMKAMGEHLQKLGEGPMGLSVGQNNYNAMKFYQKLGGSIYKTSDDNKVYGIPVPAYIIAWENKQDFLCKI